MRDLVPPIRPNAAPADAVRRLLVDRRRDGRPDVAAVLDDDDSLGARERVDVLLADQRERWQAGERVLAEWYLERFAACAGDDDLAIDLVFSEFLLREEAGEAPDLSEYAARFPRFARVLALQADFHKALDAAASRPAAASPRRTPPAPGRMEIPGYELIRELGSGGMGVVYEARQIGLNRRVALKMVRPGPRTDPEHLARFRHEAEAVARLHHPNIVEVHETGERDGCPYFSLELVEGGSLAKLLAAGPVPPRRTAEVVETLARAIHYAHEKGIIHRDLKPANILLTSDGVPKVADFGLAKDLGVEEGQTRSGTILGSPCYMAPEQAGGKAHQVGPTADVYALGAILYELLTGVPPFREATSLETLRRLLADDPVRPSRLRPKIPCDLETICLKCLEKSPRARYASARELAEDLERFLGHEPIKARPVPAAERAWRWCRRKQALAVALGLAAAAILTTIGLSISLAFYHYHSAQKIKTALTEVEAQRRQLDKAAAHHEHAYGQHLCEQGDVGQGLLWLARGLHSAGRAGDPAMEGALRRNIDAWRSRLHPLRQRWEHPAGVEAVAFSPDGRLVATVGAEGTAQVWVAATGEPFGSPLPHRLRVVSVAFSPDGKTLLTGCDDFAGRFWDVATSRPTGVELRHDESVYAVAFSPDGSRVVTGSIDKTARIWDAATGRPLTPPLVHGGAIESVAFSPDGETILTGGWDKMARFWDAATGEPTGAPLPHADWVSSVRFSPDGRTVVTGCYDRAVRLWDRATGKPIGRPLPHQHCVWSVAFSPDGSKLVSGSHDGTVRIWDVATGAMLGGALRHQHSVRSVAFSPDGRMVLSGSFDSSVHLWEVTQTARRSLHHDGFIRAVRFSPDGRRLLSASQDRTARLWDSVTAEPIGEPMRHEDSVEAIAFSPDGRTVLTGSLDRTARLWDAATGRPKSPPLRHAERVVSVAFGPDGKTVLTGSSDRTARLWDAEDGRPVGDVMPHDGEVTSVTYSPDGRLALTGSFDGAARLWDAATGRPVGGPLRHKGKVLALAFSPDGKTILTGGEDMRARLWETSSFRLLTPPLQHEGPVSVAAFSADGRTLITGGWDRVARLWDAATGRPKSPPLRHDGLLRAVALSPDGRSVLTGSYDRTAQLWDGATGKPIGPPFRHESQVWFVGFSSDGATALSGGQENSAYLWEVPHSTDEPTDRIDLAVEVETGLTLGPTASLSKLDVSAWRSLRDGLMTRSPSRPKASRSSISSR